MNKEFVPYEQSLALKELGFDEICFCYYLYHDIKVRSKELQTVYSPGIVDIAVKPVSTGNFYAFKAPLYQQAFKWFREKHRLQAEILWRGDMGCFCYKTGNFKYGEHTFSEKDYKTYEEAELECLKQLIQIKKNGK